MRGERGFAMLWAMFLVIAVGSLAVVVLERDVAVRRDGTTDQRRLEGLYAAEGAIERARHEVRRDDHWSGDAFRVGSYDVEVQVEFAPADGWHVVARVPGTGSRVEALLHRRTGGLPAIVHWQRLR